MPYGRLYLDGLSRVYCSFLADMVLIADDALIIVLFTIKCCIVPNIYLSKCHCCVQKYKCKKTSVL